MKYMPPGIVDFDHSEAVNALAQGQVAMITEWSAFYSTLTDPKTSKIVNSLAIAPEPKGPDGRKPALGGFSLAVTTQVDDKKKGAAWLFIQWVTSKAKAKEYLEAGGVSGRQSTYQDKDLVAKYPFMPPMPKSWQQGVPDIGRTSQNGLSFQTSSPSGYQDDGWPIDNKPLHRPWSSTGRGADSNL